MAIGEENGLESWTITVIELIQLDIDRILTLLLRQFHQKISQETAYTTSWFIQPQ